MTDSSMKGKPDGSENDTQAERRSFMKGAAAAGLLGAIGVSSTMARAAEAAPQAGAVDPQKPSSGLHPQGQLDARFPVTFEATIPQAMSVITEYFAALNRRDLQGMVRTLHFPYATNEWIEPVVFNSADELIANPPPSMNVTGKGDNVLKPGAFDILDNLELLMYNPVGAGISLSYSRFGPDGRKLLVCHGIYCITNNDGKWGIHLASTIFTPADQAAVKYNDAIEAFLRHGEDWQLGYSHRSQAMLNAVHNSQVGKQAFVMIGNPRHLSGNARAGKPMDEYRITGVTNRLTVTEVTEDDLAKPQDNNISQFVEWAGGTVGPYGYTMNMPNQRVLHYSPDKIHVLAGYRRYMKDGTPISETHATLNALTLKNGRWAMAGGMGEMMYHDRSNDVHT
jgi:hypothetical protein